MLIVSKSQTKWIKYVEKNYMDGVSSDLIWVVGGSQATENAKIIAYYSKKSLCIIPTCLSSDAFFTKSFAFRRELGKSPEYIEVWKKNWLNSSESKNGISGFNGRKFWFDDKILQAADYRMNMVGWAEILSGLSARTTWRKKSNFDIEVAVKMDELIEKCCAPKDFLSRKILFETLKDEVLLCDSFGNSDPEEGLEHQIAYKLEKYTDNSWLHSELVLIGIRRVLLDHRESLSYFYDLIKRLGIGEDELLSWERAIGMEYVNKAHKEVLNKYSSGTPVDKVVVEDK